MELAAIPILRAVGLLPGLQQAGRVVLLRPVVTTFHAGDENLEALDVAGVIGQRLGQGRDLNRVPIHERRLYEVRFHPLECLHQGLAHAGLRLIDSQRGQPGIGLVHRLDLPEVHPGLLLDGVGHAHPAPGQAEINGMAAHRELSAPKSRGGNVAEHLLDEVHVVFVVLVGGHGLDHGELGVVAAINALVAEIAADSIDLVKPGHDEALEVELVRDGEIHVAPERVHVRLERFRRAPAILRRDDRRRELHEPAPVQKGPDGRHHAGDGGKPLERLPVEDQIQVTLAQHQLPVLQPGPLVRQGPNGFGKQPQRLHQDRNLAALGPDHLAGRFNQVAQIEQVHFSVAENPFCRGGGLHELSPQEQLDAASLVLDMPESQGALLAPGHQATRHGHLLAVVAGKVIEDGLGEVRAMAARRIRVKPQGAQGGRLAKADIPDLR